MFEMKINITADNAIIEAINNLAKALDHGNTAPAGEETFPTIGSQPVTERTDATVAPKQTAALSSILPDAPVNPTPAATGAPLSVTPVPVVPKSPAPSIPAESASVPLPDPIPTAAPQYTLEMIATAGSVLIDAGKLDQLMALLGKFGVDSLTNLDPKHYGTIAMELRALGARI